MAIHRILLATDLSHASDVATDMAFDLAGWTGAALLIVSVIDPLDMGLPGARFPTRVDQIRERREVAAQAVVQRGRRAGIDTRFLIWDGDPGESIVAAAESEAVDLILVGSRGRGTIGRLLLGSVSEYVMRHAPCPVLVARPPRRSETTTEPGRGTPSGAGREAATGSSP